MKKSVNTTLLTLEYPPFLGGTAHYYAHLVQYYPEGIKVIDNQNQELIDETNTICPWWPTIKTLWQELKHGTRHVLIGHILPLGTAAWLLSHFTNFKYTVFLHGNDFNYALHTPRKRWLTKHILNKANQIIVANNYLASQVKIIIDQKQLGKVKVVNPGIDPITLKRNELAIKEIKDQYDLNQKIVLLSIGRLIKRKGVDLTLQALQLALKIKSNLVYAIIGQGEEEKNIYQQIKTLGLTDHVIMLGAVDNQKKDLWLQTCDIFVMAARDIKDDIEGFGIVYLEAGLAGKPVIAGHSGGVADAVKDNETGLLIDGNNPTEISQAILKLAEYENLRTRLGDQGRQRALKDFNWKNQAQKIYNIIHDVK
jgi:phosphatidylinositol alpha-1,6-mannosyltransferase